MTKHNKSLNGQHSQCCKPPFLTHGTPMWSYCRRFCNPKIYCSTCILKKNNYKNVVLFLFRCSMHLILSHKMKKPAQKVCRKTIFSGTFVHKYDQNYCQFLKEIGEKILITILLFLCPTIRLCIHLLFNECHTTIQSCFLSL